MNRQRRQEAKKKRRERENRVVRRRRVESDHCKALVMEADALQDLSGDLEGARRLLEKAVRVYPPSNEAHERLAELHIRADRFLEGLSHYEQLTRPPQWPQLTYLASVAAYRLARFEQARAFALLFLRSAGRSSQLKPVRLHARQIADTCRTLARRTQAAATEARRSIASDTSRMPALARVHQPDRNGRNRQLALTFESASAGVTRRLQVMGPMAESGAQRMKAPPVAGPVEPDRPDARLSPDVQLPALPAVTLPELTIQFDVDGRCFPSEPGSRVGPAVDVLLRRDYAALRLQRGFDELISIGAVRGLEHFWYQLETVRRLLRDFRGRVLLADEVGLGKTIEACLALKEYWMRGLVSKALILTPPSLIGQWVDELASKFDLTAAPAQSGKGPDDEIWARQAIVVASLPLVRQRAHRERLATIDYDLVIVDEAHVLKNRASAAWCLVNDLKKRFLFLLSATPVGNDLSELYNLILLLKPGLLKTEAEFRLQFGNVAALQQPERRDQLRALLREVMIRNTRAHIDVKLPRRLAATEVVPPTAVEAELHEQLSFHIRAGYSGAVSTDRWRLMMLQMQAGSSPAALRAAIDRSESNRSADDLAPLRAILERIDQPAKTTALIDLVKRSDEKKIVFTHFRATLEHLQRALQGAGFHVVSFHGGLTAAEKDRVIEQFEHEADMLVSSEVGGEGRNLQFCRTVINYDLPWNPMQLEQRVGRVHRIGQTRDVFVFNFCLAGALEEYILRVLHEKLNLFELVAGEMEMILGEFDPEREFAEVVMDLWARSGTAVERDSAFSRLADDLIAARARYAKTQEIDRTLFREEFEA